MSAPVRLCGATVRAVTEARASLGAVTALFLSWAVPTLFLGTANAA